MQTFPSHLILKTVLALFAATTLLISCKKEQAIETDVFFQQDIFPLIVTSCAKSNCHSATTKQDGYDFSNYVGILAAVTPGDYKNSELYKSLVKPIGYMPDDGDRLTDVQITKIARWIEDGAKNNSGSSGCDLSNVTFSATIFPVIQSTCLPNCHSGALPSGNISLETHAQVKVKVDDGTLLGSIRHESAYAAMPDGGAKLPDCTISQFEKWVADGAQDN
jgi:hypothetical protein